MVVHLGRTVVLVLFAIAASGCASKSKTMYRWGGYDEALYKHYKNPQDRDEFVARLRTVIDEAEKTDGLVPPGCYAEYGWALYEEGRGAEATTYFEKESKQWPASKPLMEKLIRNAARAKKATPTAEPASTTEGTQ